MSTAPIPSAAGETTTRDRELASREYWDQAWTGARPHDYEGPVYGFHRLFSEHLPRGEGLRLLELGSARGFTLTYLHKEYGYRVYGVDSSEEGIAVAREHCRRNDVPAELHCGDLFEVELPGPFDVVYSGGLVEHFSDLDRVVRRHVELLRPGGTLVIGVPSLVGVHGPLMRRYQPAMSAIHLRASCSPWAVRSAVERTEPGWRYLYCDFGESTSHVFYPVPPAIGLVARVLGKALRVAHLARVPNRWLSPDAYVIAVRPLSPRSASPAPRHARR